MKSFLKKSVHGSPQTWKVKHLCIACLAVLLSLMALTSQARVWDNNASDGSVTVGPTSPEGYVTLKQCADAFNAVSGGINANWVIDLQQGGSPYNEAASVCFANTIASGKTVTIKPESGSTMVTVIFSQPTGSPINGGIILGASNAQDVTSIVPMAGFIIDGSPDGSNTQCLELTNPGDSISTMSVVTLWGATTHNTIKNCLITNNNTVDNAYVACVQLNGRGNDPAVYEPDHLTIENCHLQAPGSRGCGVRCVGGVSPYNVPTGNAIRGLTVTGNTIDAGFIGLHLSHNAHETNIVGNHIRLNVPAIDSGTARGIFHDSANQGVNGSIDYVWNITENVIDWLTFAGNVTGTGIRGIELSNAPATSGASVFYVFNNMISGFNFTGSGADLAMIYCGIYNGCNGGTFYYYHNSINIPDFPLVGNSSSLPQDIGAILTKNNGPYIYCYNNVLRMVQDYGIAYYKGGANAWARSKVDGDVVWVNMSGEGQRVARLNNTTFTTWADWLTIREGNGHFIDPAATTGASWASPVATDLHFVPLDALPVGVDGMAGISPSVLTDIDGETRSLTHPTAGADEAGGEYTTAKIWSVYE
jgi:hypothetical protein